MQRFLNKCLGRSESKAVSGPSFLSISISLSYRQPAFNYMQKKQSCIQLTITGCFNQYTLMSFRESNSLFHSAKQILIQKIFFLHKWSPTQKFVTSCMSVCFGSELASPRETDIVGLNIVKYCSKIHLSRFLSIIEFRFHYFRASPSCQSACIIYLVCCAHNCMKHFYCDCELPLIYIYI